MEGRDDKYPAVWIETRLVKLVCRGKINWTEAALIKIIASLSKNKRGCFASNKYLASRLGISIRQVQRIMKRLTKEGKLEFEKGNQRRYRQKVLGSTKDDYP